MATQRRSAGSKAAKPKATPHDPSEGQGKPQTAKPVKAAKPPAKTEKKPAARVKPGGAAALQGEIAAAAQHGHPFYVYALSDGGGVFYIGKGQRARVFSHGNKHDRSNPAKGLRIALAGQVQRTVLAYFTCERAALDFEKSLIAELRDALTNIASGGAQQDPKERASAAMAGMLARLGPREKYRAEAHPLYDRLRAELEREAVDPTPSSIEIRPDGTVIYSYFENHYPKQRAVQA